MLYSILIYGTDADIANLSKAEEERLIGQHIVVQGKLAAERKLGPVVRLHPSTTAMTLRKGPEAYIIDGPFAETKEQLLGFYVVDCATQEEALEAARQIGTACTSARSRSGRSPGPSFRCREENPGKLSSATFCALLTFPGFSLPAPSQRVRTPPRLSESSRTPLPLRANTPRRPRCVGAAPPRDWRSSASAVPRPRRSSAGRFPRRR